MCVCLLTFFETEDQSRGQCEEEGSHMVSSQAPVTWFMFAGGVLDRVCVRIGNLLFSFTCSRVVQVAFELQK